MCILSVVGSRSAYYLMVSHVWSYEVLRTQAFIENDRGRPWKKWHSPSFADFGWIFHDLAQFFPKVTLISKFTVIYDGS